MPAAAAADGARPRLPPPPSPAGALAPLAFIAGAWRSEANGALVTRVEGVEDGRPRVEETRLRPLP
ncbi:MAG: hypothetical protein JWM10_398 [Myxococcaceae bacterium]|nr:hypothetical protein [Myxococcaceae bacterium]